MIGGTCINMNDLINAFNNYLSDNNYGFSVELLDCRESDFNETNFIQHKIIYDEGSITVKEHAIINDFIPKCTLLPERFHNDLFSGIKYELLMELSNLNDYVINHSLIGTYKLVINRYEVMGDYAEIEYEIIFVNDDEA
jgi:hypothetical protein